MTWNILEDSNGVLWVGTSTGLHKFQNGTFTSFTSRDGLLNEIVLSIYEDKDKNLYNNKNTIGSLTRFTELGLV